MKIDIVFDSIHQSVNTFESSFEVSSFVLLLEFELRKAGRRITKVKHLRWDFMHVADANNG